VWPALPVDSRNTSLGGYHDTIVGVAGKMTPLFTPLIPDHWQWFGVQQKLGLKVVSQQNNPLFRSGVWGTEEGNFLK
jgi:hypothetical protein